MYFCRVVEEVGAVGGRANKRVCGHPTPPQCNYYGHARIILHPDTRFLFCEAIQYMYHVNYLLQRCVTYCMQLIICLISFGYYDFVVVIMMTLLLLL